MRVLVIGGTGFLGYHATCELSERGHDVTVLGLPPAPPAGLFSDDVSILLRDIGKLDDGELKALLSGFEAVVFAAGADDRTAPQSPAANFFYEANVRSSVRLTASAVRAGVQRFILLGSYFTHFDREWPEMKLAEHHPYINSRKQQLELTTIVAGTDMALVVLELPYIFGSMPGTVPLWAPLVNYVRSGVPLYYSNGGSNMVSVHRVAEAIAGACERIDESRIFQVGDQNLSWTDFLQSLCAILGRDDDTVRIIEDNKINRLSWVLDALHSVQGREGGLHSTHFSEVLVSNAFFNPSESRRALGYKRGGLKRAWRDTVAACPEGEMFSNWQKFSQGARRLFKRE
ncbi:MAG: NAD-dependent epimerase/dehydratase family protein [Pseudomonadales bacterium]